METRQTSATNNLRRMKLENKENLEETKERSHVENPKGKGLQQNKRIPLETLSNFCYPNQTRSEVLFYRYFL